MLQPGTLLDVALRKPIMLELSETAFPQDIAWARIVAFRGKLREADDTWCTFNVIAVVVHPSDANDVEVDEERGVCRRLGRGFDGVVQVRAEHIDAFQIHEDDE